ncbi:PPOX class F420-dependent oxidoreductase [Lentzea californiensis]|uniref:PPOX class F420-dependent oxidoreductase n=1 Tax=Lentzea californiensis TaxID=438851 RepID=UPI0021643C07|nr:PPOX class F420-dependent oxidoreductase [Lentzea californiensis]MCR3747484.1 PPOX class probable F420-dependent enzyme [Lentzea californiensis]
MATLSETQRELLDSPNYATVATLTKDGSPQTSVVWIKRDGDDVLFSTVVGRAKERHLQNDPRVSITVINKDNPYQYSEFRGEAELTTEGGAELINELSHKYLGNDYPGDAGTDNVRVIVRVKVAKTTGNA